MAKMAARSLREAKAACEELGVRLVLVAIDEALRRSVFAAAEPV